MYGVGPALQTLRARAPRALAAMLPPPLLLKPVQERMELTVVVVQHVEERSVVHRADCSELLQLFQPENPKLPFVYDSFHWDHCRAGH